MAKNYSGELAEWFKNREQTKRSKDTNLVAFLAVRDDVREALEKGYSRRSIWEHLCTTERISYRYDVFVKHVRRHITEMPPKTPTSSTQHQEPTPPPGPTQGIEKSQNPLPDLARPKSTIPGFVHNPLPSPEELF